MREPSSGNLAFIDGYDIIGIYDLAGYIFGIIGGPALIFLLFLLKRRKMAKGSIEISLGDGVLKADKKVRGVVHVSAKKKIHAKKITLTLMAAHLKVSWFNGNWNLPSGELNKMAASCR